MLRLHHWFWIPVCFSILFHGPTDKSVRSRWTSESSKIMCCQLRHWATFANIVEVTTACTAVVTSHSSPKTQKHEQTKWRRYCYGTDLILSWLGVWVRRKKTSLSRRTLRRCSLCGYAHVPLEPAKKEWYSSKCSCKCSSRHLGICMPGVFRNLLLAASNVKKRNWQRRTLQKVCSLAVHGVGQ